VPNKFAYLSRIMTTNLHFQSIQKLIISNPNPILKDCFAIIALQGCTLFPKLSR